MASDQVLAHPRVGWRLPPCGVRTWLCVARARPARQPEPCSWHLCAVWRGSPHYRHTFVKNAYPEKMVIGHDIPYIPSSMFSVMLLMFYSNLQQIRYMYIELAKSYPGHVQLKRFLIILDQPCRENGVRQDVCEKPACIALILTALCDTCWLITVFLPYTIFTVRSTYLSSASPTPR